MNHDTAPLPLDLYAIGRGLAFAATLAFIGACVFAALLPRWRDPADDESSLAARALTRVWRVAVAATAILVMAHLLRAYGQVRSFLDPLEPTTWDAAKPVLFQTAWGRGWIAQVAVATLGLVLALLAPRRSVSGLALIGTAALAVVCTDPLTGHAIENPWGRILGVGLHAVHLIGGGVWLGTLFSVAMCGLAAAGERSAPGSTDRGADDAAVARMIAAFSPVALTGAGLAIGAGLLMAYAYIGSFADLWGTTYGRTLLVKTALLGVAMALGAWNWRRVSPRLGTASASAELSRSATIELLVGTLLLAVTAILVALPAPRI